MHSPSLFIRTLFPPLLTRAFSYSSPILSPPAHSLPSFPLTSNVGFNYLAGRITGTPSASLKSLNVASNLLTGTFPASSTTACDARNNCLTESSKCLASGSSSQRTSSDCDLCGAGSSSAVICNGGVCTPDTTELMAALTSNSDSAALLPMQCSGVRIDATAALDFDKSQHSVAASCLVSNTLSSTPPSLLPHCPYTRCCPSTPIFLRPSTPSLHSYSPCTLHPSLSHPPVSVLGSLKAALGVPFSDWGGNSLCTVVLVVSGVSVSSPGPSDLIDVLCSPAGAVVEINLNTRQLAGSMHADISKLTALTALRHKIHASGLHLLNQESVAQSIHSNPSPSLPPVPLNACHRSLGSNYLTGSVPVPGAALKHLDLENNYLVGTFPSGSWQSCSARTNCFSSAAACTADGGIGTVQRDTCSICGSVDGTGVLCSGGGASTCQPTPASLASLSVINSISTPALPMECSLLPAVPVNSTAMAALLSIKTALGVTHTGWAANAVCTLAGTAGTVASGSLTGVECDSAGNPVKIASGQGMLCGGTGVCTPNAAALFTAKMPNTAAADVLPMSCVDLVCAAAAPIACPTDWRCQGLKCASPAVSNCYGYLCTP
ncbi:unnamed protein product [Closterium sp. Yama58-4]|nr:unnamed protein product [Closterium sp. Yama58-4]